AAVKDYCKEKKLRLHMPGHIGGRGMLVPELSTLASLDLTEVAGLDDLHLPRNVIQEAALLMAEAYAARESFFLVNGATSGIHALFMSMQPPSGKVLLPRNAHRSFFGGMVLAGTSPVYIPGQIDHVLGVALTVLSEDIEDLLGENPDAEAVFITSPSYYGSSCDIEGIEPAVHAANALLLVDEAHGGHFPFHRAYPRPALQCGADAVVNGLHKTLPVLNQGACLHLGKDFPNRDKVFAAYSLLTTTSPSYPILASLDLARELMCQRGEALLDRAWHLAGEYRKKIQQLKGLDCHGEAEMQQIPGLKEIDPLKLLIIPRGLSIDGFELAQILRDSYKIEVEHADNKFILAMMSMFHERADWESLYRSLEDIAGKYAGKQPDGLRLELPPWPQLSLLPREAFMAASRTVRLKDSQGLIAAEMVAPYPPGIPCLLPGELISPEIFSYLEFLQKSRVHLQGPHDPSLNYLKVIE
ncbi:MAG: aminotransferase class I/II-fold pyridoxal phosphate-dependent enzyme, partial [Syntrophomonadaceae bacterium]|nr:aminotransferase class I/II-fold pyridoxal phosphate-dependent enzyme [Syntrophomonadaceae bacterium]